MRTATVASLSSFFLLAFAACGGSDNNDNPGTPDAPSGADARLDSPPGTITFTGTATGREGLTPPAAVPNATIAAYRNSDESTPVATTTTDAQGNFALVVDNGGNPLDGYIRATHADFKDTYLYPAAPITADTAAPILMVNQGAYNAVGTAASVTQDNQKGLVALVIFDGTSSTAMPVAGATVSSTPAATYRYNKGGRPVSDASASSTDAEGVAYMFNAPPDVPITVSATKTGVTFKSHGLKAAKGALTTTFITP